MEISECRVLAEQSIASNEDQKLFLLDQHGAAVTVLAPIKPPSGWTHFCSALANWPGFRDIESFRQAQAEVAAFDQQKKASARFLGGFVDHLRETFGDDFVDVCSDKFKLNACKALTARSVVAVIGDAVNYMRAKNDACLDHFLDAGTPRGIARSPIINMDSVFSESSEEREHEASSRSVMVQLSEESASSGEGVPLDAAPAWREKVGEKAASFIAAHFKASCRALPAYAQSALSEEQLKAAAQAAIALYEEICNTPGMTVNALEQIMTHAASGVSALEIARVARERAVLFGLVYALNTHDFMRPFAKDMASPTNARREITTPVSESIRQNVAAFLRDGIGKLIEDSACGPSVETMLRALKPRLDEKIEAAIGAHCRALGAIERSKTLTPGQKNYLRELAATRRFDESQLAAYEALTNRMAAVVVGVGESMQLGDYAKILAHLRNLTTVSDREIAAMKTAGEAVWDTEFFSGEYAKPDFLAQCAEMAVDTVAVENPKRLFKTLVGERGRQWVQGLMLSGNSWLLPVYGALLEVLAWRSGVKIAQGENNLASLTTPLLTEGSLPSDLKKVLFAAEGHVDAAFHQTMSDTLQVPISSAAATKITLPGGHLVGKQFWEAVDQGLILKIADATSKRETDMVDRRDWEKLDPEARKRRLEAGYVRLIALCGGDESKALALTLVADHGLAAGFSAACEKVPSHNPLHLSNGTPVMVSAPTEETMTVTFKKADVGGSVRIRFEYEGRHFGIAREAGSNRQHWLDRASSGLYYHVSLNLEPGGAVRPVRPAYFSACLPLSGWNKDWPEPVIDDLRHRDYPGHDALHAFARAEGKEQLVLLLDAVHLFKEAPTPDHALAIMNRFFPSADAGPVAFDEFRLVRRVLVDLVSPVMAAFRDADHQLNSLIERDYYAPKRLGLAGLPGWPANYPAPASYKALLKEANEEALAAFHAIVGDSEQGQKMLAFKAALKALEANTTFARAQVLFDEFIKPGSPNAITISELERTKITIASGAANTLLKPGLFDSLMEETLEDVGMELLTPFLQSEKAGPAQPRRHFPVSGDTALQAARLNNAISALRREISLIFDSVSDTPGKMTAEELERADKAPYPKPITALPPAQMRQVVALQQEIDDLMRAANALADKSNPVAVLVSEAVRADVDGDPLQTANTRRLKQLQSAAIQNIDAQMKAAIPEPLRAAGNKPIPSGDEARRAMALLVWNFAALLRENPDARSILGGDFVFAREKNRNGYLKAFVKQLNLNQAEKETLTTQLMKTLATELPNDQNVNLAGKLGVGVTGEVFSASFQERPVVVKRLKIAERETKDRIDLIHELLVQGRIHDDPNIPKVLGVYLSEGFPHIVMEAVNGSTIGALFDSYRSRISPPNCARIALHFLAGTVRALDKMAQRGLVHGDLKPTNVMFDSETLRPMLIDYGSAAYDDGMPVDGTAIYAAPEQLNGKAVTPQSDIFSLGSTLYELVGGTLNANGEDPYVQAMENRTRPGMFDEMLGQNPLWTAELAPVKALIEACWALDPLTRPTTAQMMQALLGELVQAAEAGKPGLAGNRLQILDVLHPKHPLRQLPERLIKEALMR